MGTDLFDWKGMIHCHSFLSHDSRGTFAEIQAAAKRAHLDFLVMTDHQTEASIREGLRGRHGDTLFLVGAEIRTPEGTVLAFPLRSPLRRWTSAGALVAEAGRQGAIAVMGHAEAWKKRDVPGLAGIEIVNLHAGALAASRVALVLNTLFFPAGCLMERVSRRDPAVLAEWDRRLRLHHPFAAVGGGDAHANIRLLGPLGGTIADYPDVFSTVSTHVLAAECTERAIVDAVRAGRTYVAFDVFGEGRGFDFRAVGGAEPGGGERIHLPGSTVARSPGLRLRVRVPRSGRITFLRDGVVVRTITGGRAELADPAPGIYRVEVATASGRPWLFSGSIRVKDP